MTHIVLGTDGAGNEITTNQYDRQRGTYVLGSNGYGKSKFMLSCILQDIEIGMGVTVIDPIGGWITGEIVGPFKGDTGTMGW